MFPLHISLDSENAFNLTLTYSYDNPTLALNLNLTLTLIVTITENLTDYESWLNINHY